MVIWTFSSATACPETVPPNRLYLGNERGHFADIASRAGIRPDRSIGSAFADYDNDGDLDLYVANFNRLNTFYRNESNGTFTDVTQQTRTQMPLGGYSAFFFDFDQDGWLDLFSSEMSDYQTALFSMVEGRVKSDKDRSFLYHNSRDGSFQDATYRADLGRSHGSVGAHFGDFDNDGFPDIYLANGGAEITRLEADALLYNRGGWTLRRNRSPRWSGAARQGVWSEPRRLGWGRRSGHLRADRGHLSGGSAPEQTIPQR